MKPSDSHRPNGVLIGFHDSIELHRRIPILCRYFEDVVGQSTSHTSAGCGRAHHETCVGDMAAGSWLIWMHFGGSYDCTVINGDEYSTAGLVHPPGSCRFFTGVCRPAVGVAGVKDLLHESPDGGPIRIDDIADLHFGILTVVRLAEHPPPTVPVVGYECRPWGQHCIRGTCCMPLDALAPAWDVGPEVLLDQEGSDHAQRSVLLLDDDHDVSDLLPSLDDTGMRRRSPPRGNYGR